MCAQFLIRTKIKDLKDKYGIIVPDEFDMTDGFDEKVVPYRRAPVILVEGDHKTLKMMNFSLIPSWSKEPKVKFATHNARLESIAEKPTWKRPFVERRCLVPMTAFIEPIYVHDYAGNMVRFSEKSQGLMTAAGFYDEWINKETGEVISSFSIITSDPPKFVAKIGHDRCPVFLEKESWKSWLDSANKNPKNLIELLNEKAETFDLEVEIDRPLKPGWEKRK